MWPPEPTAQAPSGLGGTCTFTLLNFAVNPHPSATLCSLHTLRTNPRGKYDHFLLTSGEGPQDIASSHLGPGTHPLLQKAASLAHGLVVCDPSQDVTEGRSQLSIIRTSCLWWPWTLESWKRGFCQGELEAPAHFCRSQAACPGSWLCPFLAGHLKQAIALWISSVSPSVKWSL